MVSRKASRTVRTGLEAIVEGQISKINFHLQETLALRLRDFGLHSVSPLSAKNLSGGSLMATRLNYGKTFLLGFGFFGLSVVWGVYNAFVPIFLSEKFHLSPIIVGFFMTLDNIAALLIQPPVGAWSDRLRSPMGRRIPFLLIGAPIPVCVWADPLPAVPLFVACTAHCY
jgi:hypothetical protein